MSGAVQMREAWPTVEEAGRAMQQVAEACLAWQTTMGQVAAAMASIGRKLRGPLWRRYHEEGCLHGETREGLARWCQQRELLDLLGYDYPTGRWHR